MAKIGYRRKNLAYRKNVIAHLSGHLSAGKHEGEYGWISRTALIMLLFLSSFALLPAAGAESVLEPAFTAAAVVEDVQDIILSLDLPSEYKKVAPGGDIRLESQILLLREQDRDIADIIIEYAIIDRRGLVLAKAAETKGGIERISTTKELAVPSDAQPGIYEIVVKASHGDITKQSSVVFEVIASEEQFALSITSILVGIGTILLFFFVMLVYIYLRFRKLHKLITVISTKNLKSGGFIR
ncbi:hypothetical protein HY497_01065 [Candidatus Woesearchaeota archaeon]|nr:hypothetical protein [Candidatus Woesearchaeota archaeon]